MARSCVCCLDSNVLVAVNLIHLGYLGFLVLGGILKDAPWPMLKTTLAKRGTHLQCVNPEIFEAQLLGTPDGISYGLREISDVNSH